MNGIKRVYIDDCLCYSSSSPCRANSYSTGRQENPSIRHCVGVCQCKLSYSIARRKERCGGVCEQVRENWG